MFLKICGILSLGGNSMLKQDLIKQLKQYTSHEQIYKTYYHLQTEDDKKEYLSQLKRSACAKENLWLPGFFDSENLLLSEQTLFEGATNQNKSIVLQKHNRYTPSKLHQHEFFEMIYVYSGNAVHQIQGIPQTISEGDVLIIAPSVTHSLAVFDDSIVIDALIRKGTFLNHFFEFLKKDNILSSFFQRDLYLNKHQPCITFHTCKNSELEDILLDMYLECLNEDELSHDILSNLCRVYFAKLVRYHQSDVDVFSPIAKENERLLSILTYIQTHYNQVTLKSAASHFHYAPSYLSNYIKDNTGETFINLVKNAKLSRAEYLLNNSNLSIQEICLEIGYESPAHFIRLFKERCALSPTQYRKAKKSGNPFLK